MHMQSCVLFLEYLVLIRALVSVRYKNEVIPSHLSNDKEDRRA